MHRFVDETDGTVSFMLPHSRTIAALRDAGLVVEDLLELRPPADATSTYRPLPERARVGPALADGGDLARTQAAPSSTGTTTR